MKDYVQSLPEVIAITKDQDRLWWNVIKYIYLGTTPGGELSEEELEQVHRVFNAKPILRESLIFETRMSMLPNYEDAKEEVTARLIAREVGSNRTMAGRHFQNNALIASGKFLYYIRSTINYYFLVCNKKSRSTLTTN